MVSEVDAARWMVAQVVGRRCYYQVDLVREMRDAFGDEWIDPTRSGRAVIHPRVRRKFRTEHGGAIRWDPLGRCWNLVPPKLRSPRSR